MLGVIGKNTFTRMVFLESHDRFGITGVEKSGVVVVVLGCVFSAISIVRMCAARSLIHGSKASFSRPEYSSASFRNFGPHEAMLCCIVN